MTNSIPRRAVAITMLLALTTALALARDPKPGDGAAAPGAVGTPAAKAPPAAPGTATAALASDSETPPGEASGTGKTPPPAGPGTTAAEQLVVEQAKIADNYARFKNELLKLAELSRASDPARADLLEKAVQQISASGTDDQFRAILKLLDSDLLRDVDQAVDKQTQVQSDLNALLQLLLSENRDRRNASEKERLRSYIKDIDQIIRIERGLQGQTERSGDTKDAKRQGQLADRTQGVARKIADNEESKRDSGASKDGTKPENQGSDRDKAAPKNKDKDKERPKDKDASQGRGVKEKPKNPDKSPGDQKPGKPADGGQPQQGKKPGQPGEGKDQKPGAEKPDAKPADDQKPDAESPDEPSNGRKRIEQATQRMRKAQQRLDEAKRSDAAREQEEAIAELEKAKAELEEILRQVREEEVEKTLAMLEARFRHMLKLQQAVYDATVLLDKKPVADRSRADEIEASRLSRRQQQIIEEVDKAILLLREDGSAVAFPEAVGQLREDMDLIAQQLNQSKIGSTTQRMEQDAIDALKELIAALEKAQKDLQQRRGMPAQGQPADPPLVDSISELKMIRALQVRVNRRTRQYEEMIHSGESAATEMLPRLRQLAEHEQRIHRIARDLHLGRNE